ncbi:hypothetical protein N7499_011045 [Penicillium canescens]|nr:hypothetical protein N7499_011045 [Penicillium canescens]KAJ6182792.1 hypothetical protein N7485_001434 [Penicillium canescens]
MTQQIQEDLSDPRLKSGNSVSKKWYKYTEDPLPHRHFEVSTIPFIPITMATHLQDNLSDTIPSILESFLPGLSQFARLISVLVGLDLLSYSAFIFPLIALPAVFTFILPWILPVFEPFLCVFISSAEIKFRDTLYPQTKKWMANVRFWSWSSSVIVGIKDALSFFWEDDEDSFECADTDNPAYHGKMRKIFYTPSQRNLHFFRHRECWFALYRDLQPNRDDPLSRSAENILIYYFFWNHKTLQKLMEDIQINNIDSHRGKIPVSTGYQHQQTVEWRKMSPESPRGMETLAISDGMKQSIISDLEWLFRKDVRDLYTKLGIPYRRGYLFYGAPGTGKTSLCRAIATMFELPIYIISLATIDSHGLRELFRTLPPPTERCMVLFEDTDSAGLKREGNIQDDKNGTSSASDQKKTKEISLSVLLNSLDGVGAHQGHIFVMTTNDKPALDDPALTRFGRIDREYEFLNPDKSIIVTYFSSFFAKKLGPAVGDCSDTGVIDKLHEQADEFAKAIPDQKFSPATLQDYFLKCDMNPTTAVANAAKLVSSTDR